jgi:hypothetical protein
MGQSSDVRPGAIVQVKGKVAANGQIDAQSVVVLTGFATIQ